MNGRQPIDVRALSAPELLRLVLDTPDVGKNLFRCDQCGFEVVMLGGSDEGSCRCLECDGTCAPLELQWWARAAARMRSVCRRDKTLIPRLLAEWRARHGDVPLPPLPDPFSWLNVAWKQTRARGRPIDAVSHYTLAHMVDRLQAAGISLGQILRLLRTPDLAGPKIVYDQLPDRTRRFLGKDFRDQLGGLPFVSSRAEMSRRLRWARTQWTDPLARLRGERVRIRRKKT